MRCERVDSGRGVGKGGSHRSLLGEETDRSVGRRSDKKVENWRRNKEGEKLWVFGAELLSYCRQ